MAQSRVEQENPICIGNGFQSSVIIHGTWIGEYVTVVLNEERKEERKA